MHTCLLALRVPSPWGRGSQVISVLACATGNMRSGSLGDRSSKLVAECDRACWWVLRTLTGTQGPAVLPMPLWGGGQSTRLPSRAGMGLKTQNLREGPPAIVMQNADELGPGGKWRGQAAHLAAELEPHLLTQAGRLCPWEGPAGAPSRGGRCGAPCPSLGEGWARVSPTSFGKGDPTLHFTRLPCSPRRES